MTRAEIEEKVKNFLIEDLEVEEDKISPDALLRTTWASTASTLST